MTERNAQSDPDETPEDVASLYSWANLHGAKYRDFSASRAQTREKARQRVEQAIEEERLRVRQEAEAQRVAEAARVQEDARRAEIAARQAQAVQQAAYEAQQELARRVAQQQSIQDTSLTSGGEPYSPQQPPQYDRFSAPPAQPFEHQSAISAHDVRPSPPPYRPPVPQPPPPSLREERATPSAPTWSASEKHEPFARPAWLTPERAEPAPPPNPPAPDDTLQGSRERLATRWYALQGIFDGSAQPAPVMPAPAAVRPPVMAVFSLAGGVGKTSLAATLARALSARGERVLLVDTAAYGLMPFFFGARDQRPGLLRTFSPPIAGGDAPIQMITLDPEGLGPETAPQEPLSTEITAHARGVGRVIVDLATASGAITRRVLRLAPQILVPLAPDMTSVVSVSSIDTFFQRNGTNTGKTSMPHYVLNQYDSSLPLHLDVREILRQQLGDRLLPFTIRHAPAISEALAEGMTVIDYAPNSGVVEDFVNLAAWVKSLSAPAITGFRGVRWSER